MERLASFHHSAKGNILLLYFNNRQKCMNINMMVGTLANNHHMYSDKRQDVREPELYLYLQIWVGCYRRRMSWSYFPAGTESASK